ncbi:CCA tRNA nucleotidyltransferase [Corynebacterium nasicanis]|uniref:CCA tRNA nucleotidyltransferase n=1 Tax=Corynebacterium nasicanis TaxID=1448267 RepID=A0ABW1QFB4_9CORY
MNADDPLTPLALLAQAERTIAGLPVGDLVAEFQSRGLPIYLVGGSVRDALLGRLGNDLDFTTPARPDVISPILEAWAGSVWDTGIEFGTVSAVHRGQQVEITTFRSDTYDGVSRNPAVMFGDTLEGDLIRRDFRVNAMAVEMLIDDRGELTARFHDPLGGLADLAARRLDTPDAPEISFRDDPLRMLRAARFVSQLGFSVAPRVKAAMSDMAGEIERITVERIQVELDKLMLGEAPWAGMNLLVNTGLAGYVFPEIPAMRDMRDEHNQHKDVYAHSMQVLRQAIDQEQEGPDLVLRWAALLHDCGKPDTRAWNEDGRVTFHHHEVVGAKKVRRRLRALKYPKHVIGDVSQLIYLHMRFYGFGEGQWTDSAVRRYVTDAGELLPRLHKLVRADSTTRNQRKAARLQRTYDHLEERIADIAAREDLARVRPDLDGNEIMQILGVPAGPVVGRAWAFLKELRLERGPLEREAAIAELRAWWEAEQSQGTS